MSRVMKFLNLFKVNNDIDEKNVVGFLAMVVFVVISIAEVVLNIFGIQYTTNPVIYESFLWIILGSFGISAIGNGAQSLFRGSSRRDNTYYSPEEPIQENLENINEYRNER